MLQAAITTSRRDITRAIIGVSTVNTKSRRKHIITAIAAKRKHCVIQTLHKIKTTIIASCCISTCITTYSPIMVATQIRHASVSTGGMPPMPSN
jgi:hypothetical protein